MSSPLLRVGALSLSAILALTLAACGDEPDPRPTSGGTTATDTPTADPSQTTSTPVEPTEPPAGTAQALPIYFAGEAPDGLRLFREFAKGTSDDPLTEAALLVDGGTPLDPDYRTLWPGGAIDSAEVGDDQILVHLNSDAFTEAPDGMPRREARLAIQQLVYTLQGVQQERLPVQFMRESGPQTLFGLSTEGPFKQAKPLTVLNLVNITAPESDAAVGQGPLRIEGVANSFEANVVCTVEGSGDPGTPFTADGWMGNKLFPFAGELDLSAVGPGEVTISCSTDDPSDGEGIGAMTDTKAVTVG